MSIAVPEKQCRAKTRRGTLCENPQMPNGRCEKHGGKTPKGPALPQFVNGRHSKYLPKRLMGRYEEALRDRELLDLSAEIALVDARIAELLSRSEAEDSPERWAKATRLLREYIKAEQDYDLKGKAAALSKLTMILEQQQNDAELWAELGDQLDRRRKLVEAEQKRRQVANLMVTTEQAMAFVAAVVDLVRANVSEPRALAAISAGLARLTDVRTGGGDDAVEAQPVLAAASRPAD